MPIQKGEIKKIVALLFLFLGFVIMGLPLRDWIISTFPFNPIIVGLVILAIGSYLFKY